jgi:hypothetical protein
LVAPRPGTDREREEAASRLTLDLNYQEPDSIEYLTTFFAGCPQANVTNVQFPDEWGPRVQRQYEQRLALEMAPRLLEKLRVGGADLTDVHVWARLVWQLAIHVDGIFCGPRDGLTDWLRACAQEQRPSAPDLWLHELVLAVMLKRLGG